MTAGGEQVIWTPRTDVTTPKSGLVTRTGASLLAAFPPRPIAASWPVLTGALDEDDGVVGGEDALVA